MFDAPFNKPLPRQGDPRKLAQQNAKLSGYVPLKALGRLAGALRSDEGLAQVALAFDINEERKLVVQGRVSAAVSVTCQRCLEAVELPLEADLTLAVVRDEAAAKNLPKSLDPWILEEEGITDLYPMVEDELLLSLPAVAYHSTPCIDESLLSSGEPVDEKPKDNPFQVLERLKKSSDSSD